MTGLQKVCPREEVRRIYPLFLPALGLKLTSWVLIPLNTLDMPVGSAAYSIIVTTGTPGQETRSTWCRIENRHHVWLLYYEMMASLGGESTNPVRGPSKVMGSSNSAETWTRWLMMQMIVAN